MNYFVIITHPLHPLHQLQVRESTIVEVDKIKANSLKKNIEFVDIWSDRRNELKLYKMMVEEWISKTLPIQVTNPRTNKIEYNWGGLDYSSAQR